MHSAQRISRRCPRDTDVFLRGRQIAPLHQGLQWNRGDAFVGVVTGGGRSQSVWIDPTR